jgi:hypothetical protein
MQTAAPLLAESHCILGPAQQKDEMCSPSDACPHPRPAYPPVLAGIQWGLHGTANGLRRERTNQDAQDAQ